MKNIGGNSLVIKEININLVRKALKSKRKATKQEIANSTGLSIVTVGTVLQHLLEENEVFESELCSSSGGRPAKKYKYNENFALTLIIFPYEMNEKIIINSSIVNLSGKYLYESDLEVKDVDLKIFEDIIELLLKDYPEIQAIGFGHPGIEVDGQIILSDYKMLRETYFTKHFSNLYKLPVIIENDVNAAVIGFGNRKKIDSNNTLVYIYFPDQHPPGAGVFINGKLFKGRRNFAGEIATMPLGITWNKDLYNSFEDLCEATTKLIVSISSILNPDTVVLNGSFLTSAHIEIISEKCRKSLPKNIVPIIVLSDNFIEDYKNGLAVQALDLLEPEIVLERKVKDNN